MRDPIGSVDTANASPLQTSPSTKKDLKKISKAEVNTDQEQRKLNHICVYPCPSVVKKNPIQCRGIHTAAHVPICWCGDLSFSSDALEAWTTFAAFPALHLTVE